MCVIFIADKERPTGEMVEKAYSRNPKGAGIAWRENGFVKWRKGLTLEEIQPLIEAAPFPFIAHFRVDTCGGDSKEMTHPFAVDVNSPLFLSGRTKGYMMFHNGHWGPWKDRLLDTVIKSGKPLPGGRWTDSRAMAFVAAVYGVGALELIDEKSVALSPTDLQVYGNGWSRVNGVVCSNKFWEDARIYRPSEPVKIEDGKTGGSSQSASFRRNDQEVQGGANQPQTVEESQEEVRSGHEGGKTPSIETPEAAIKATEWVRGLNPSEYRRPLRQDVTDEVGRGVEEALEHDRRTSDARRGIVHLGRL